MIYAHGRYVTSGFLTNLLEVPINVGLQAKCLRFIDNRVGESISGDIFTTGSEINVLTAHAQTLSSQKSSKMVSRVRNYRVFIGKRLL